MSSMAASSPAFGSDKVYTKPAPMARFRKLYLDETTADIHFTFENETMTADTRIPAHKTLLAMESDAFKAMFYGDLKETGDVRIVDASADAFKEFLQFFYFDQIKLTMANANEVIYLVKKYMVADSLDICAKFLTDSLSIGNVCTIYDIAIRFDMLGLKFTCKNRIVYDTNLVFQSKDFKESSKPVLVYILKSDSLSCTESQVFHACMDWIKVASGRDVLTKELVRKHLGDLFYDIRFGSMKFQEFADLLPSYGKLFTNDEYQEIIQMIASSEFEPKIFKRGSRGNPKCTTFNSNSNTTAQTGITSNFAHEQVIPPQRANRPQFVLRNALNSNPNNALQSGTTSNFAREPAILLRRANRPQFVLHTTLNSNPNNALQSGTTSNFAQTQLIQLQQINRSTLLAQLRAEQQRFRQQTD